MSEEKKCSCPLCNQDFTPENGMTPEEHLANGIIQIVKERQRNPDFYTPHCPRCGHRRMLRETSGNADSRHADVLVCADCGTDEALRAARNDVLPITKWHIVQEILNGYKA